MLRIQLRLNLIQFKKVWEVAQSATSYNGAIKVAEGKDKEKSSEEEIIREKCKGETEKNMSKHIVEG